MPEKTAGTVLSGPDNVCVCGHVKNFHAYILRAPIKKSLVIFSKCCKCECFLYKEERISKVFTITEQANLEPGHYWIKRSEPDGPPYWEIAQFHREGIDEWWSVKGSTYKKYPTQNPNASNAWRIGDRVDL